MRECETKIFFWGCGLNPSLYGNLFISAVAGCLPGCFLVGRDLYRLSTNDRLGAFVTQTKHTPIGQGSA